MWYISFQLIRLDTMHQQLKESIVTEKRLVNGKLQDTQNLRNQHFMAEAPAPAMRQVKQASSAAPGHYGIGLTAPPAQHGCSLTADIEGRRDPIWQGIC